MYCALVNGSPSLRLATSMPSVIEFTSLVPFHHDTPQCQARCWSPTRRITSSMIP